MKGLRKNNLMDTDISIVITEGKGVGAGRKLYKGYKW